MKFAASLLLGLVLTATPAIPAQAFGRFASYEHCRFTDGLTLVENTPLAKGIEGRTVKTVMGTKSIPLAGGTRLLYAYPDTEPFANVKVEQIPTADYKQAKQDLIANFEQILTGDDTSTRNYVLKPRLNGAEIYGLDRTRLEGGTLGIYLFFVDRTHTATTIYFLNGQPDQRKFSSLEDYAALRDTFVRAYTHCATGGASTSTATRLPQSAATSEPAAPVTAAPEAKTPEAAIPAQPLPDAPLPNGAAAATVPADLEPAAKPVSQNPAAKSIKKPTAKSPAKPAAKSTMKPAAKPATTHPSAAHSEKKSVPSKSAKTAQKTGSAKPAKPRAKPESKPKEPAQN